MFISLYLPVRLSFFLLNFYSWIMKMNYSFYVFAIFVYFLVGHINSVSGQALRIDFDRLTIDDGLSQSTVYSAIQDSSGYMWFGTEDGLNRYNGHKFTVFRNNPDDSTSLSNNRIIALHVDRNKNLWIGTLGGGLNQFSYDDYSFKAFTHKKDNPRSIAGNLVMSINDDVEGNILAGTANSGLSVLNVSTGVFENYKHNPQDSLSLPGNSVRAIHVSSNNQIFVGTNNGMALFDIKNGQFIHISNLINTDHDLFKKMVFCIQEDSSGNLWISIEDSGVIRINTEAESFKHYCHNAQDENSLVDNSVLDIYIDDEDVIWFATYGGLQRFLPDEVTFQTYKYSSSDPYSISSNLVRCICEDNSGIVWVGTYRDGLNSFKRKYSKFSAFRNRSKTIDNLPPSSVRSLAECTNGNVIVGTYGNGLAILDPNKQTVRQLPFEFNLKKGFSTDYTTAIVKDTLGNIWFGFDGAGLYKHSTSSTSTSTHYTHSFNDENSLPSDRVRCLHIDNEGVLWVGTTGEGVARLNNNGKSFTTYLPSDIEPTTTLSQERIICINDDDKGNLWVGTSSEGLNLFNPINGKAIQFKHNTEDSLSISSNRILSIYQDSSGRLWIGTANGLNLFNYKTRTFKVFNTSHGLPNNVIYGILEDFKERLWLSTNNGLSCFNYNGEESHEVNSYTRHDGLQSNEFTEGAFLKHSSGNLVFGGIGGVNFFKPDEINPNPISPIVNIENISTFSNDLELGQRYTKVINTYSIEKVNVPFRTNNITFKFSALHFDSPKENTVLYKLNGFENSWVEAQEGQFFASYTNLKPGDYTFRVIAANSDGVWNHEGAILKVYVEPPFWLTWWFIGLAIVSLILFVIIIIRLRTNQLVRSQKILEHRVQLRTRKLEHQKEELQTQAEVMAELYKEIDNLALVVNQTDNGVIIMDAQGKIEWVNSGFTKLTGYNLNELEEFFGDSIQKISKHELIDDFFERCIGTCKSIVYEAPFCTKSNDEIWLQSTITPIVNEKNEITKVVAIDSDITDLKKAHQETIEMIDEIIVQSDLIQKQNDEIKAQRENLEKTLKQLYQSEKMASLGVLTAGVAHEINNPINFVYAGANVLMRDFIDIDQVLQVVKKIDSNNENAETIIEQIIEKKKEVEFDEAYQSIEQTLNDILLGAQRVAEIVQGLSSFSRSDTENFASVDLQKVINSALILLRNKYKNRIEIVKDYDNTLPEVECRIGKINQVIMNILSNAIDAINDKGTVCISTKHADERCIISIKDNGTGIPEDVVQRIFDPFYTTKKVGAGTGLGLSISFGIVEEHKGSIEVKSQPDVGSEFIITLPIKQEEFKENKHDN